MMGTTKHLIANTMKSENNGRCSQRIGLRFFLGMNSILQYREAQQIDDSILLEKFSPTFVIQLSVLIGKVYVLPEG
jgi:hypothetical protein